MSHRRIVPLAVFSAALVLLAAAQRPAGSSFLVRTSRLLDGTGAPARPAAVRVEGGRIAAVGDLAPAPDEPVVEAGDLVLAPGFIDTHSHADRDLLELREATAAVSQGITTVVVGQDGGSPFPLAAFFGRLEATPPAVNVASFVGHGVLRREVLGDDVRRPATPAEIERMAELVRRELDAGGLGLGTGLEYEPGLYASTEEVVALARVAAAAGGRYISHIRSEDRFFWDAVDEILAIGREAGLPVQISHVKLAMRGLHGQADRLVARLDAARADGVEVSADLYPYPYWQSTLRVFFPERRYDDLDEARLVLREIAAAEDILLVTYEPEPSLAGKTLAAIAAERGEEPAAALLRLVRDAEAYRRRTGEDDVESVVATSMAEADIERLLRWPHTNVATDGELAGAHPRGYGTYPRILGRYVRERGVLSLEEAVRKMTSLAADHMGFRDRGRIAPGFAADLVLFDPERVVDRATPERPHALSEGIEKVWVNGVLVWDARRPTGRFPGAVLRR